MSRPYLLRKDTPATPDVYLTLGVSMQGSVVTFSLNEPFYEGTLARSKEGICFLGLTFGSQFYQFCKSLEAELNKHEGDTVEKVLADNLLTAIHAEREARKSMNELSPAILKTKAVRESAKLLCAFRPRAYDAMTLDLLERCATVPLSDGKIVRADLQILGNFTRIDSYSSLLFQPISEYTTPNRIRRFYQPSGQFRRQLKQYARKV